MITTKILTDEDPLKAVLSGAESLYKAVSVTMGPRGNNVIFRKHGKKVGITHDGVTVAKMVKSNIEAEDAAIDILREAATKLDATTGDGTTTVTVLTYQILKEAATYIENGESRMKLKLALESYIPKLVKEIEKHVDTNVTEKKLIDIATISSGDKKVGESVGKTMHKAGKDTPIMLGFSGNTDTYTEVIDGFKIDAGPASPYLMDGAGTRLEMGESKVIVVDAKLRDKDDVTPIMRLIAEQPQDQRDFLLVASDIAGDALSLMVVNRYKGFANIAVARVPEYINSKTEYLSDVAISCGAKVISRNGSSLLREPKLTDFGTAKQVSVEPRETVIIGGGRVEEDFNTHIKQLEKFAKGYKTESGRQFADNRLKTLEQKVVSIFVGGQSESEAEELHYRYEDAVGACRAALRGGVVPGGGTLLYSIGAGLSNSIEENILSKALRAPMIKILSNAGLEVPEDVSVGRGINVTKPENGVTDLVKDGVIDPVESEIECVKTAITVAGLLITAGAMVIDEGKPDETQQQASTS